MKQKVLFLELLRVNLLTVLVPAVRRAEGYLSVVTGNLQVYLCDQKLIL